MTHDQRKADHIRINLEEDVQFHGVSNGFENYRLTHRALPEIDLHAVDVSTELFGRQMALPLIISSMTGGTDAALAINRNLALAAQVHGAAMGLGSQRAGLEQPHTAASFDVRQFAPDILLFANLGAVQLNYGYGLEQCRRAVDMVQADALILHLNPLQEALQADGNWNWSGLAAKIEGVCRGLGVPVVVKEVGWGIDAECARLLAEAGVAAIDVAGAGGTSWSAVESYRAATVALRSLAGAFADWGIPTAEALLLAAKGAPGLPLFASGGIRSGIEAAKALALGASLVGLASPFLKAASVSAAAVSEAIDLIKAELRVSMFCAGAANLQSLRTPGRIVRIGSGDWPVACFPGSEQQNTRGA